MFILTADQVIPRQGIYRHHSQLQKILAIVYRQWLFVKGESYPSEERNLAIEHTRNKLDSGQMCILVVDKNNNYVVCYHDPNIELIEEDTPILSRSENLETIVEAIRNTPGLIRNNRHKLRTYPRSIVGTELVDWLCHYINCSRESAIEVGQLLLDRGWLHHTWDEHDFKDEHLFYRFYQDEKFSLPLITG